jgi:hypothetical protein
MQIKTTLIFHLTSIRINMFKSKNNNKCWQGCSETGALIHCWWECKLAKPLWLSIMESSMEIPQKAKYRTAI